MLKKNKNEWIKGETYSKRILIEGLKEKINLIEDIILPKKGKIPKHKHDFTDEIFYIVKGEASMYLNNKEFDVAEGEMVFVKKNEEHGFRNNNNTEFKMIVFKINYKEGDSFLKA